MCVAGAGVSPRGRDARGGAPVVAGQRRRVLHPGALRVLVHAAHLTPLSPRPPPLAHTLPSNDNFCDKYIIIKFILYTN